MLAAMKQSCSAMSSDAVASIKTTDLGTWRRGDVSFFELEHRDPRLRPCWCLVWYEVLRMVCDFGEDQIRTDGADSRSTDNGLGIPF